MFFGGHGVGSALYALYKFTT